MFIKQFQFGWQPLPNPNVRYKKVPISFLKLKSNQCRNKQKKRMKGSIGLDTGKAYRWREQNLYRNAYNEDRYINELKIRVSFSSSSSF